MCRRRIPVSCSRPKTPCANHTNFSPLKSGSVSNYYVMAREHMKFLWDLVSKPVKFPAPSRRRRGDREIPKARMNLALYARVSKPQRGQLSDAQAKDQNPEVQLRELREWCKQNKHAIAAEYVERLSGKNTKRPQLQKLMRDATKGLRDIDGVLVWRLDRFGRSVRDLHNLIAELNDAKIAFICLKPKASI